MDRHLLQGRAHRVLADAMIPELPRHYRGKVRDNYDLDDGRRIIIATDRLSAFDRILTAVPFKGQVLTQSARHWFDATADICPNHVLDYPDPNVVVARRLEILPVEIVVNASSSRLPIDKYSIRAKLARVPTLPLPNKKA